MRITSKGSSVARKRLEKKLQKEHHQNNAGAAIAAMMRSRYFDQSGSVGQEVTLDEIVEQQNGLGEDRNYQDSQSPKQSIRTLTRRLQKYLEHQDGMITSSCDEEESLPASEKEETEATESINRLVTRKLLRHNPFFHKTLAVRTASSSSVSSSASSFKVSNSFSSDFLTSE
jgi:hypothetical protein